MALTEAQRRARRQWRMRALGVGASDILALAFPSSISFNDGDQPYTMTGSEIIVISDTGDTDTTYTMSFSIQGGGTLTLASTTGLTGSGDGTDTISYSGSLANWNTALDGMQINGLSGETVALAGTITGDTSGRATGFSISVTSTTVGGGTAGEAIGLLLALTKAS